MATTYQSHAVHAELQARIDQLDRDCRRSSMPELCRRVDALRSFAAARGYSAIGEIAGGLGDEIARSGRAALIRTYLDGLREAANGDPTAVGAGSVYLAAVGARLN